MIKYKKLLKRGICICAALGLIGCAALAGVNHHVKSSVADNIITYEQAAKLEDVDCILVLGCQVKSDGTPSLMLKDRLSCGVELYNQDVAPKLLMSGDHGRKDYNEVKTMKDYAIDNNIPSGDIFTDHAGFSTYESIYRAKEIFQAKKIVVVTQEYHLYRTMYIAESMGLEVYGVAAEGQSYAGQIKRDFREMLARTKDFITVAVKPEPTYLGEVISITGNGDVTNDY